MYQLVSLDAVVFIERIGRYSDIDLAIDEIVGLVSRNAAHNRDRLDGDFVAIYGSQDGGDHRLSKSRKYREPEIRQKRARGLRDAYPSILGVEHKAARPLMKRNAGRREPKRPALSVKQRGTEVRLKKLDLLRYRGLRDAKPPRRNRHASRFSDTEKYLQRFQDVETLRQLAASRSSYAIEPIRLD
jgi:hypothetical protein